MARRLSLSEAITLLRKYTKQGVSGGSSQTLEDLRKLGKSIITEAVRTRDTGNVLHNQHDAYAYSIYYNGQELTEERYFLQPEMTTGPAHPDGISGREASARFFSEFKAPTGNKLTLLVVNAMSYTYWQENGLVHNSVGWRFRVLSQEISQADDYARKHNGKVELIGMSR